MVSDRYLSRSVSGDRALMSRWWYRTRYGRWWLFDERIVVCSRLRWLILIGMLGWNKFKWALSCTMVIVRTLSIALMGCWVSERLISCWEACLREGEDEIGLHLSRCEEAVSVTVVGLWINRCVCSGGTGLSASWILFHRCRNVFWWISTYTIQPGHAEWGVMVTLVSAHAPHLGLGCGVDVVWYRTDQSRL